MTMLQQSLPPYIHSSRQNRTNPVKLKDFRAAYLLLSRDASSMVTFGLVLGLALRML